MTAKGAVLAWHVTDQAGAKGTWDAFVDAKSGRLLRRQSLVDYDATTTFYPRYPGAPHGGTATTVNLTANGWLDADEKLLRGPFSRAYSDVDASDDASNEDAFDEEVRPGTGGVTSFQFPLTLFNGTSDNTDPPNCETFAPCTWDSTEPTSWQTNRAEATMQSFTYVNTFHDHLAAPPIGFDEASGNFRATIRSSPRPTTAPRPATTAARTAPSSTTRTWRRCPTASRRGCRCTSAR